MKEVVGISEDGEGLESFCPVCHAEPCQMCSIPDPEQEGFGIELTRKIHKERLMAFEKQEKKEWPKKVSYTDHPEGRIDLGTEAPFDGKPVLIRTKIGWVEAWWDKGRIETYIEGEEYEGWCWVCYDDKFQCELDDAIEWMPLPI